MATAAVEERELLKAIRWYDGFVVALANPSFLITGLGFSAISLGGWGAVILWLISVVAGALHNYIYSEMAAMFPDKAGGIAIYAHEAWKRYLSPIGPMSAFGYWIGWSVVLSASGIVVGFLVQAEWYPSSANSSFWNHNVGLGPIDFTLSFPIIFTACLIAVIWLFNVFGIRPAVWVGYVTGALLIIPLLVFILLPYLTGDFHTSNLTNQIDLGSSVTGSTGIRLVIAWLYVMCWSAYGFECCATFAPEYRDTVRDTPLALRSAAVFGVLVYGLLPLGAVGTIGVGDNGINASNASGAFYVQGFKDIIGSGAGGVAVFLLCAGIVLAMNTATADGSRALYGIARDDMTIKQLGTLNRYHVPAVAMTVDAVLNILLLIFFAGPSASLRIIGFSNLGYVMSHVFAMSGFLLLRRDRPDWPRPLRVGPAWVPVAACLATFDLILLVVGSISFKITGYDTGYRVLELGLAVLVIAVILYVYRVVVQDRRPFQWRILTDETPDAEALAAAGRPAAV